jgi:hypothetical protein
VAVEVHGHAVAHPLSRAPHELGHGLGRGDPQRVDDDDLPRSRLHGLPVDALVEVGRRARRVDAEEGGVDPLLGGEAHGGSDPPEHRLARHADGGQLEVRDRRLDHRGRHTQLHERLEVGRHRAREAPDLRSQSRLRDQLHGVPVVLGDAREPGLDALDAERVEEPRDLELLLRAEHDADGLLAVSQRRVVQPNAPPDSVRLVDGAGPDEAVSHSVRKSSGNEQSFSVPSAVTR